MEKRNYRIVKRDLHRTKQILLRRIYIGIFIAFISLSAGICMFTSTASGDLSDARYKYYTSISIDNDSNLWDISLQYMSDEYSSQYELIDEIKELNHMSGDDIMAGEHLIVPYYSSEASL